MTHWGFVCDNSEVFFVFLFSFLHVALSQNSVSELRSTRVEPVDKVAFFADATKGRKPWVLWQLEDWFLGFSPDPVRPPLSSACDSRNFASRLTRMRDEKGLASEISSWFSSCRSEIENTAFWSRLGAVRMLGFRMDIRRHPWVHLLRFHLPNGQQLLGALAWRGDFRPRPLVVFRSGVFTNLRDFSAEKFLIMQLFEQGQFNVLVLESATSADYLAANARYQPGGLEEGVQNFLLARLFRDPREPISKIVSSLHLVGLSMGGHSVLLSAAVNSLNPVAGKKPFDSFLALCPVSDFVGTMEHNFQPGLSGTLMDIWGWLRTRSLADLYPQSFRLEFMRWLRLEPWWFTQTLRLAEREFSSARERYSDVRLPAQIQGAGWAKSLNFSSLLTEVQEPLLVIRTEDDPLVPVYVNRAPESGRHLEAILSGGSHCSLPVSYRWSVVTDIMQGLFARHAHLTQTEEFRIAVPVEPAARAEGLQAFAQSEFVTLRFAQGVQTELNVPWSSIGFPRPEEITPEIQALVQRWAQHNITWSQVETNEGPAVVLVWEYVPL